jgi:prepilin-type N-terminal cleavage/methylation domain-containing protein
MSKTATGGRLGANRKAEGFSLPELLVVIAILGIMVVFGGPAVNEAYRAYKVRSAADSLITDLRALRYNAVANRASRTMTLNDQSNAAPNQYTYVNAKGLTVTFRLETGTNIETTSPASITFNNYGATGASGNTTVNVSGTINDSRNDRYTITITPSGTVRSAYSTF